MKFMENRHDNIAFPFGFNFMAFIFFMVKSF